MEPLERILTPVQRGMLRDMGRAWARNPLNPMVVVDCSRRLGKSHLICAYWDEIARTVEGADLHYVAATESGLAAASGPIMEKIIAQRAAMGGAEPRWIGKGTWVYPETGSRITLAGADELRKVNRQRGRNAHGVAVDEAAYIAGLAYAIGSVYAPMITTTRGRMIVASSSPESPEHTFSLLCKDAEARGAYVKRTIHDATHLTRDTVQQFHDLVCKCGRPATTAGGHSTTWRREALCEKVVDEKHAVVPEMATAEPDVVAVWNEELVPRHRNRYTAVDGGYVDMLAAALGWVDHETRTLFVEDEVVLQHCTSRVAAQTIRDQEVLRWGADAKVSRAADVPQQTAADLRDGGLDVRVHRKDEREVSIDRLRHRVQERRLVIHPRCVTLIAHLRGAIYASNRKDFARVKAEDGASGHHFDGLDALRYLSDLADRDPDPTPDPMTWLERAGIVEPQRKPVALGLGPRR